MSVSIYLPHQYVSDDAFVGEAYLQLIFSIKKMRPSLTTSKEGLKIRNIHLVLEW
jgi:hypothetical protein